MMDHPQFNEAIELLEASCTLGRDTSSDEWRDWFDQRNLFLTRVRKVQGHDAAAAFINCMRTAEDLGWNVQVTSSVEGVRIVVVGNKGLLHCFDTTDEFIDWVENGAH